MAKNIGEYPEEWGAIAFRMKDLGNWRCERCGHVHDVESGHVLTVHHLWPDKSLCEEWNLAVLCQRCHLSVQARVDMLFVAEQGCLFCFPGWLDSHVEGFRKWLKRTSGGSCEKG